MILTATSAQTRSGTVGTVRTDFPYCSELNPSHGPGMGETVLTVPTVPEFIQTVQGFGVVLTVAGDKLRWDAPKGLFDDCQIDFLRQHKQEIIAFLSRPVSPVIDGIDAPGRPFNRETFARAMDPALDPYVAEERAAIRASSQAQAIRYLMAFLMGGVSPRDKIVTKAATHGMTEADIEGAAEAIAVGRSVIGGVEMWDIK